MTKVSPPCFIFHQDIAGLQGQTWKPTCIWVAPHSKCYVRAYTLCCYLKHQYQISAWNTTSDLVGKTDSVHYRQINISSLCIDLVLRSLRQELKSGQGFIPNILILLNLNEFVIMFCYWKWRGLKCLHNLCLIFKIILLFSSSAGSEVFISVA